jgi:RimJ/RimL family protein N-acetyltransferase
MKVSTTPAARPGRQAIVGTHVSLVPLDAAVHAAHLYAETAQRAELWRYLFDPPPPDEESFRHSLEQKAFTQDPFFYAIVENETSLPVGHAAYLRIEPQHRVIEVGSILFSPRLQRTTAATEAMYLMAKHAFEELGYRRYEWKCNALNEPSKRAAVRLGFTFEGIFRQHMIVKGESRDTAWFSMLDCEWPSRKSAMERWLADDNFEASGQQRRSLESFRTADLLALIDRRPK